MAYGPNRSHHLICPQEDGLGNRQPEGLGGLEVDEVEHVE